jgi:hypothetical protein
MMPSIARNSWFFTSPSQHFTLKYQTINYSVSSSLFLLENRYEYFDAF